MVFQPIDAAGRPVLPLAADRFPPRRALGDAQAAGPPRAGLSFQLLSHVARARAMA